MLIVAERRVWVGSEKVKRAVIYTDFADQLGDADIVRLPGVGVGTNVERTLHSTWQVPSR